MEGMILFLERHGNKVEVTAAPGAADAGKSLIDLVADKGADLIVMGAFGHSPFHELLLGAMSRSALPSSLLALWMVH